MLKDLFNYIGTNEDFDIKKYANRPFFITESTNGYKVLELFKKERVHYAIVVDEYGSSIGIVTMDDVMDALVGDASEMGQEEYEIVEREDGSWLIDGQYSLIDFRKEFNLNISDHIIDKYNTVAGFIIHQSSTIPNVGDKIKFGDLSLEVIDKDGQRIDKILAKKISN